MLAGTTKNCTDGAMIAPPKNINMLNTSRITTANAPASTRTGDHSASRCEPARAASAVPSARNATISATTVATDNPSTTMIGLTACPTLPSRPANARHSRIGTISSHMASELMRPLALAPSRATSSPVTTATTTTSVRGSTRLSMDSVCAAAISIAAANPMLTIARAAWAEGPATRAVLPANIIPATGRQSMTNSSTSPTAVSPSVTSTWAATIA